MKKLFLILIISLSLPSVSPAKISKKAFPLARSMSELWKKGKTEDAVASALELHRLYPPLLIQVTHITLAQQIKRNKNNYGLLYLQELSRRENKEVNKIITPLYLWNRAILTNDKEELTAIRKELLKVLKNGSNYDARTERYSLLILTELDKKETITNKERKEIVNNNIRNLEVYLAIKKPALNKKDGEKLAWAKYLLATNYYYLFSTISNEEKHLKKASDYSPHKEDKMNKVGYFYDAYLINGTVEDIYKAEYEKFLANNNQEAKLFKLLCEKTYTTPNDDNIKSLRKYYAKLKNKESFESFWESYINKQGKPAPKIKLNFKNEVLDLTKKSGNWIYIDVWGTWCKPCRKELPELQAFYTENQKKKNSQLKIYTLSYNSANLAEFITKNQYTFPVTEIDKKTNDSFEVIGYPTKILITPKGNYIKIPFGVNWKMHLKNYTLIKE